jgi:hypothetical protein
MEYTEEFLKKMIQVGTLGYPLSKVANVLEVDDFEVFKKDFYDQNHTINLNYNKGLDKADLIIDSKLFELAKNGDLKALEKYERRKIEYQERYQDEFKKRKRK